MRYVCSLVFALSALGCGQGGSQAVQSTSESDVSERSPKWKEGPRYDPSMWVEAAVFSPDGKRVLTQYAHDKVGKERPKYPSLTLWDTTTGKEIWTLKVGQLEPCPFAFLPDGKGLLVRSGDHLVVLDSTNGKRLRSFDKDDRRMNCIGVSPDGMVALVGGASEVGGDYPALRLWNVASGKPICTLETGSYRTAMFSPDSKLAMVNEFGVGIQLWDIQNRKLLRVLQQNEGWGGPIAFSRDGKFGVSGRYLRDIDESRFVLWDIPTGKAVRSFGCDSPFVVTLTPDGKGLLSGSLDKQTLTLWEVATGRQRWSERIGGLRSVAFSPNAKLAFTATGHSEGPDDLDHRLKLTVWDAVEGKPLRRLGNASN